MSGQCCIRVCIDVLYGVSPTTAQSAASNMGELPMFVMNKWGSLRGSADNSFSNCSLLAVGQYAPGPGGQGCINLFHDNSKSGLSFDNFKKDVNINEKDFKQYVTAGYMFDAIEAVTRALTPELEPCTPVLDPMNDPSIPVLDSMYRIKETVVKWYRNKEKAVEWKNFFPDVPPNVKKHAIIASDIDGTLTSFREGGDDKEWTDRKKTAINNFLKLSDHGYKTTFLFNTGNSLHMAKCRNLIPAECLNQLNGVFSGGACVMVDGENIKNKDDWQWSTKMFAACIKGAAAMQEIKTAMSVVFMGKDHIYSAQHGIWKPDETEWSKAVKDYLTGNLTAEGGKNLAVTKMLKNSFVQPPNKCATEWIEVAYVKHFTGLVVAGTEVTGQKDDIKVLTTFLKEFGLQSTEEQQMVDFKDFSSTDGFLVAGDTGKKQFRITPINTGKGHGVELEIIRAGIDKATGIQEWFHKNKNANSEDLLLFGDDSKNGLPLFSQVIKDRISKRPCEVHP